MQAVSEKQLEQCFGNPQFKNQMHETSFPYIPCSVEDIASVQD